MPAGVLQSGETPARSCDASISCLRIVAHCLRYRQSAGVCSFRPSTVLAHTISDARLLKQYIQKQRMQFA
jgi:hypothetical protein